MRKSPARGSSREAKPRNVRILKVHILTYHGFFDLESEILKPRWLPTICPRSGSNMAGGQTQLSCNVRSGRAPQACRMGSHKLNRRSQPGKALDASCALEIRSALICRCSSDRQPWRRRPPASQFAHVHADPGADWSAEALAARVALSPSRFAARLLETMGESVMGYVGRWRLNVACHLLRETESDLDRIAERVGYASVPAFSRAFKAQVGRPPAQWRRGKATFVKSRKLAE